MIVFFDVDEITYNYIKERKICDSDACFFEQNVNALSEPDYQKIKEADIISIFIHSNFNKEILAKFPKLKLLTTRSTGINHIDTNYCKEHGIIVENVPRYGEATVAEFALGMCLNLTRKVNIAYNDLKNGICDIDRYMGKDLYQSTLGVIGTGAIGRHAIKIASGLGMKILAYDLYPNKELTDIQYVSLDEIYAKSDFITLHCPLTKDNYHMLDNSAFNKMKKGVIIINTARGELIDNEALYRALKDGKVAAAGLDALEEEGAILDDDIYLAKPSKIPQNDLVTSFINMKLLQLPNVIITPHIAFNSIDAIHRILEATIDNIAAFKKGELKNVIVG